MNVHNHVPVFYYVLNFGTSLVICMIQCYDLIKNFVVRTYRNIYQDFQFFANIQAQNLMNNMFSNILWALSDKCMNVCVYKCKYVDVYAHMIDKWRVLNTFLHVSLCGYIEVRAYVHLCINAYVYASIHIYMYREGQTYVTYAC